MKPEKNTKSEISTSINPARKFLNNAKHKQLQKYEEYSSQNLAHIEDLLNTHPDKKTLGPEITKFLEDVLAGDANAVISFPAKTPPGLISLLLNNMALWIGNTQQVATIQQRLRS